MRDRVPLKHLRQFIGMEWSIAIPCVEKTLVEAILLQHNPLQQKRCQQDVMEQDEG
jgi:hypothetical protein